MDSHSSGNRVTTQEVIDDHPFQITDIGRLRTEILQCWQGSEINFAKFANPDDALHLLIGRRRHGDDRQIRLVGGADAGQGINHTEYRYAMDLSAPQAFVIIEEADHVKTAATTQLSFQHSAGTARAYDQNPFETLTGICNCSL